MKRIGLLLLAVFLLCGCEKAERIPASERIRIEIKVETEDDVYSLTMTKWAAGREISTGGVRNADCSPMKDAVYVDILRDELPEGKDFTMEVGVSRSPEGEDPVIAGYIALPAPQFGSTWCYRLTGSREAGYQIRSVGQ